MEKNLKIITTQIWFLVNNIIWNTEIHKRNLDRMYFQVQT